MSNAIWNSVCQWIRINNNQSDPGLAAVPQTLNASLHTENINGNFLKLPWDVNKCSEN